MEDLRDKPVDHPWLSARDPSDGGGKKFAFQFGLNFISFVYTRKGPARVSPMA